MNPIYAEPSSTYCDFFGTIPKVSKKIGKLDTTPFPLQLIFLFHFFFLMCKIQRG